MKKRGSNFRTYRTPGRPPLLDPDKVYEYRLTWLIQRMPARNGLCAVQVWVYETLDYFEGWRVGVSRESTPQHTWLKALWKEVSGNINPVDVPSKLFPESLKPAASTQLAASTSLATSLAVSISNDSTAKLG